jgi:hypothetical protein
MCCLWDLCCRSTPPGGIQINPGTSGYGCPYSGHQFVFTCSSRSGCPSSTSPLRSSGGKVCRPLQATARPILECVASLLRAWAAHSEESRHCSAGQQTAECGKRMQERVLFVRSRLHRLCFISPACDSANLHGTRCRIRFDACTEVDSMSVPQIQEACSRYPPTVLDGSRQDSRDTSANPRNTCHAVLGRRAPESYSIVKSARGDDNKTRGQPDV